MNARKSNDTFVRVRKALQKRNASDNTLIVKWLQPEPSEKGCCCSSQICQPFGAGATAVSKIAEESSSYKDSPIYCRTKYAQCHQGLS